MKNVIRYILLISILSLTDATSLKAQYYSVNFDYQTIAAMVASFAAEAGTEELNQQTTAQIADSYGYSEVATAGIYASKLLDRNALKSVNGFANADENYYYTKIYRLVANKIIPRTIKVTQKLVKEPSTAIYWGSHLMKAMEDTKSLCNQFSALCTNSKLSFSDINFLEFAGTLSDAFNLQQFGDFASLFDSMSDIGKNFTTKNIENEFDNLQNMAVGLASAGSSDVSNLFSSSAFNSTFLQNVSKITATADKYSNMWSALQKSANNTIKSITDGDIVDISSILTTSNGNSSAWISAYSSSSDAQYYKQKVYIYCGSETYYEDTYDSYSMDWNNFMDVMNAKLKDANSNDEGKTYHIGYGTKQYYTASNVRKLNGANLANFVTKCSGSGKLIDGSFQYKCGKCGKTPSEHTKQCSMSTSLTDCSVSYAELDKGISDTQAQMDNIQQQIDALNARNAEILKEMASLSISSSEYKSLQTEYQSNRSKITTLQQQYDALSVTLAGYKSAKQEAIDFENSQTDDQDRIPSVMLELQKNFSLEWTEDGHWEGYTFVRKATMKGLKSTINASSG